MWGIIFLCVLNQIKGVVIDYESKNPLFGALIHSKKHRKVTYSDLNGVFNFPIVKLGDTLIVTYVGYKPETVYVDKKFLRIYMIKKEIEVEPIKVVEKPFAKKYETPATIFYKRGSDIQVTGWENPLEGISVYPSVVQGHIRGGRTDEVLYTLDNAPIIENIKREVAFDLPVWAISEMELYMSNFEPEFGNFTAGLVRLSSKKMNIERKRQLIFKSDAPFYPSGLGHIENIFGTIISDKDYFISARYTMSGTRFWDVWKNNFPYPVDKKFDILANKTFNFLNGLLILQDISFYREWREYEHLFKYYPQGLPLRKRESHRFGLLYNKILEKGFSFDLNMFYYILNYQILGKNTRDYDFDYVFSPEEFVLKGDKPVWSDRFQNRFLFKSKLNYVSDKVSGYFGLEGSFYDLYVKEVRMFPDYIESYNFLAFMTYVNNYRYKPYQLAGFISFKFRDEEALYNFGLRYDIFNPRAYRPAVEIPPEYPPPEWIYEIKDSVKASVKTQFSPRFGFSYRLNYLIFKISYGQFFQIPQFEYLYSNPFYNFQKGFLPLFGNPDLKPSKTTIFEVSFLYLLNEFQNVSITFYTRESNHLVDAIRIMPETTSLTDLTTGFTLYSDVGEAYVKGTEISWEGRYSKFSWTLSFTYMTAEGTFGTWLEEPYYYENVFIHSGEFYPLSWDQRYTISFEFTIGNVNENFLSFYLKWGSGLPYTPDGGPPNSKRLPPNLNSRLKIGKKFKNLFLGIIVDNVFNRQNVLWVDGKGNPGGKLNDPLAYSEELRLWVELFYYF